MEDQVPIVMEALLNPTILLLVKKNLLSLEQAYQYQHEAQIKASPLLPYCIHQAKLCPVHVAQLLADQFGFPWIDLESIQLEHIPTFPDLMPLLRQHPILPIRYSDQTLIWVIDDPNHILVLKEIQFFMQCPLHLHIAAHHHLSALREAFLRDSAQKGVSHYLQTQVASTNLTLDTTAWIDPYDEKPILSFVHRLLHQAITLGASDLHFEPYASYYRIRYRIDGKLHELARPMLILAPRLASCLKIMANLNIAERRLPQDGRFSFEVGFRANLDCRINTCPTTNGEKIAIRFLNTHAAPIHIEQLRLSARDKACFLAALHKPHGLILVTGPTGSGKTMTLYAALNYMNTGEKNISTAEDPVEITIPGINQVQIDPTIGLNFTDVLRAFLRQDPDIMMIGEIRDYASADIAMKAALTGHLVLATLHTQDCIQSLSRLKQLGIPNFLMSNLILIITQRLIRILCTSCKILNEDESTYSAQGCHRCHQGYKGRQAIFEIMPISDTLRHQILQPKWCLGAMKERAVQEGMITLREAGVNQVLQGVTTIEEINTLS